jgi:hypothetical protein
MSSEACGSGRTPVSAWHPDPAHWREVAWLCRPCRRLARATGGTIVLTWQWPGHTLGEIRTVPIVERPERRTRRDRSAPSSAALPPAESVSAPPSPWFDDEAALARLDAELAARFAEVEAINPPVIVTAWSDATITVANDDSNVVAERAPAPACPRDRRHRSASGAA